VGHSTSVHSLKDKKGGSTGRDDVSTVEKNKFRRYSRATLSWAVNLAKIAILPNILWLVSISFLQERALTIFSNGFQELELGKPFSIPLEQLSDSLWPLIVGLLLAYVANGLGGDYIAMLLTKKNKRSREAEHQLINFILPLLLGFVGLMTSGWLLDDLFLKTLSGLQVTGIFLAFSTSLEYLTLVYAFECYPTSAGFV
jgi:hypothetical protein